MLKINSRKKRVEKTKETGVRNSLLANKSVPRYFHTVILFELLTTQFTEDSDSIRVLSIYIVCKNDIINQGI